ncbi:hypothetical protein KSS87_001603 [Heliosperma pusillum]|nr:hypothetical protein KSS87_001603 [Heliosperma pusillum]
MGYVMKVIDAILLLFFILKAIGGPVYDVLICIPKQYHPKFLVHFSCWYIGEVGDYLVVDKPYFIVGLAWMELLLMTPFSIINVFGILSNKSWFKTTCLIHGVFLITSMVAIISDLMNSGKASDKLVHMYYTFMGLCILVAFKGGLLSFYCVANKSPLAMAANKKGA